MLPNTEDYAFSKLGSYAVYQWNEYKLAAHHKLICQKLEAVERGEITRLMIFMPPRHGKSMLASEFFPAWFMGRNPAKQVMHVTYAQELASGFGRKVRNQIKDERFQAVFKGVIPSIDSTATHRFHTNQGGVYNAIGVGGGATGKGADLLLIDDPVRGREDAESSGQRQKMKDWYQSVAYTRLMPNAAVVIIQTRWHEDDLSGWLLKEHAHENWDVLSMPAINKEGEALWHESYPVNRLLQIKEAVGSRDWNALYQQRPVPLEGGLIKLSWFNRYVEMLPLQNYRRIVISWDTAQKTKEINDYSVCTIWGEVDYEVTHLLYIERGHYDYPTLRRRTEYLAETWKPHAVLIEDKSSGISLTQELQKTRLSVIAIEPNGDKVMRAMRVSPMIEAGKVYLPVNASWLADFESEISAFPFAAHDDQVDSFTQYLNWGRNGGVIAYEEVKTNRWDDDEYGDD